MPVADDGGQDIIEIVGYAAGKGADALHLLGMAELFFELLILGDVSADAQYTEELALGIEHRCFDGIQKAHDGRRWQR